MEVEVVGFSKNTWLQDSSALAFCIFNPFHVKAKTQMLKEKHANLEENFY